eukprot:scaffold59562_cov57-Attheya_sp.AAC.4
MEPLRNHYYPADFNLDILLSFVDSNDRDVSITNKTCPDNNAVQQHHLDQEQQLLGEYEMEQYAFPIMASSSYMVSQDPFIVTTPLITSFSQCDNKVGMSNQMVAQQQQHHTNAGGQAGLVLKQNFPFPTNAFHTETGSSSSLMPALLEQQGNTYTPLFALHKSPTRAVVSTYRDFSRLSKDEADSIISSDGSASESMRRGSSFPKTLYEILSRDDITDIISWCPHGRAWRVHKPKAFEDRVLSQHFRHSKYSSFTRQVNGWGFRRITQGKDQNAYYHEQFLRGFPHLCKRMRRKAATVHGGSVSDTLLHQYVEPDFYRMKHMAENPIEETRIENAPLNQSDEEKGVSPELKETMGFEGLLQNPDTIASNNEEIRFEGLFQNPDTVT